MKKKRMFCPRCGGEVDSSGVCLWCDGVEVPPVPKKNGKKGLIVLLAALVLVMGVAGLLYNRLSSGQEGTNVGADDSRALAPDFTVYDAQGNPVKLSDFRGKPVVLNFWASWCGPCKAEMPDFDEKSAELQGEVVFLMVNATGDNGETVDTASAFVEQSGYGFPVFYDTDYEARIAYGIAAYPTTYFIDADGYAVAYGRGTMSAASLQQGIDMISK